VAYKAQEGLPPSKLRLGSIQSVTSPELTSELEAHEVTGTVENNNNKLMIESDNEDETDILWENFNAQAFLEQDKLIKELQRKLNP